MSSESHSARWPSVWGTSTVTSHWSYGGTTWYGAWGNANVKIPYNPNAGPNQNYPAPSSGNDTMSIPTDQFVVPEANRTDGYTIGQVTLQGVRAYDSATGQFMTPDAYAGDVHDPMSQEPFMWNRNNPYEYSDPSDFDAACIGQSCLPTSQISKPISSAARSAGSAAADKAGSVALKAIPLVGFVSLFPSLGGTTADGTMDAYKADYYGALGKPTQSEGGPGAGKRFSSGVQDGAYGAAGGLCVYCGRETAKGGKGPNAAETDHGKAKSKGGNNTPDNANNFVGLATVQNRPRILKANDCV